MGEVSGNSILDKESIEGGEEFEDGEFIEKAIPSPRGPILDALTSVTYPKAETEQAGVYTLDETMDAIGRLLPQARQTGRTKTVYWENPEPRIPDGSIRKWPVKEYLSLEFLYADRRDPVASSVEISAQTAGTWGPASVKFEIAPTAIPRIKTTRSVVDCSMRIGNIATFDYPIAAYGISTLLRLLEDLYRNSD